MKCTGECGQEKPADQFWPGDRRCKACRKAANRLRYRTDEEYRQRMTKYQREYYRRNYSRRDQRKTKRAAQENSTRPMARLTPQELAVVETLLAGHTTREAMASRLVLSPKTVQTHLSNIFAKLHIFSTVELVLVAILEGMPINTSWEQLRDKKSA